MTFDVNYSYVRLMLHRLQHRLPGENAKKHLLNLVFQMEYHPSLEEVLWRLDDYIEYVLSFRHPHKKVLLWENFYRDYDQDHINPYWAHRSGWGAELFDAIGKQKEKDIKKLDKLFEDWHLKKYHVRGWRSWWIIDYQKSTIKEFRNSLNRNNRFLFDSLISKKFWR